MCAHSRHRRQKKKKTKTKTKFVLSFLRSSLLPPDAVWPAASGRATRSLTYLTYLPAYVVLVYPSSFETHLSSIFLSFLLFVCVSLSIFLYSFYSSSCLFQHVRHRRLSHFVVVVVVFSFVTRVWRSSYCSSALFDRSIINATQRHATQRNALSRWGA